MLRIVWLKNFDGHGMATPLDAIYRELRLIENSYDVQLFSADKIIKLDIPFSELYHQCSDKEWKELLQYVEEHFGSID